MPERFECTTLAKKRYINILPFLSFPKATPCVEVWQTSNLRRLRLGEKKRKKKKKEEQTTG